VLACSHGFSAPMQHCVGCDVGISACVGMFPWILCSHAALCWLGCRHQHSWCWHVLIDLLLQCSDCQREPPLTVLLYTSSHRGQHRMGAGYCDIPSLTWSALVLPFLVRLLLQCSDWTFSDSSNAHLTPPAIQSEELFGYSRFKPCGYSTRSGTKATWSPLLCCEWHRD
jgi:hypothetical protein